MQRSVISMMNSLRTLSSDPSIIIANGELWWTNIRSESRKTSDSNQQSLRVVTLTVMTISVRICVFVSLETYFEIDFDGDDHHQ